MSGFAVFNRFFNQHHRDTVTHRVNEAAVSISAFYMVIIKNYGCLTFWAGQNIQEFFVNLLHKGVLSVVFIELPTSSDKKLLIDIAVLPFDRQAHFLRVLLLIGKIVFRCY